MERLFYYLIEKLAEDAAPGDQSFECQFFNIRFDFPRSQLNSRQLAYTFYAPGLHGRRSHDKTSYIVYNAELQRSKVKLQAAYQDARGAIRDYTEDTIKLYSAKVSSMHYFPQYLYQNDLLSDDDFYIDTDEFSWDNIKRQPELTVELPDQVYLNYKESYNFTVIISMSDSANSTYDAAAMKKITLYITISNVDIVVATADKFKFPNNNTVTYEVSFVNIMSPNGQYGPGEMLRPVTVDLAIANSSLNCIRDYAGKVRPQGYYHTTVMIGCPPAQHIEFDWKASIEALANASGAGFTQFDCLYPDPAMRCFDYRHVFYPHFNVIDMATGARVPYTGNYTLRIVNTASEITTGRFTDEEIGSYNSLNGSSDSLIWEPYDVTTPIVYGWPVYNASNYAIRWYCYRHSPCSGVVPSFPRVPELYFLIEFSNGVVPTNNTMCNYTMLFWLRLHGLPLDPLYQSLPICVAVLLAVILFCFVFFLCHRNNMALYTSFALSSEKRWRSWTAKAAKVVPTK